MPSLVFDNSPLSHFARADALDQLAELTHEFDSFVTQAVLDELRNGIDKLPALRPATEMTWLTTVRVDRLQELQAFAEYARRLGSGDRDIGEASTLAWAETHGAIALVDERAGTRHGRERGVEVHGTLWLVARGVGTGRLSTQDAERLVDALRDAEAWFPRFEGGFVGWARERGLL